MSDDGSRLQLRRALGRFATGVTVITAAGDDGHRVGVTVNSFTSVSMDPPLILWCLDLTAPSLPVFRAASHFCINVLSAAQRELCDRFARASDDKFDGLHVSAGLGDAPRFSDCLARFECARHAEHGGGDHAIFVGRIERFDAVAGPPLIFFGGGFPYH